MCGQDELEFAAARTGHRERFPYCLLRGAGVDVDYLVQDEFPVVDVTIIAYSRELVEVDVNVREIPIDNDMFITRNVNVLITAGIEDINVERDRQL